MIRLHLSPYPDQVTASLIQEIRLSLQGGRRAYLVVPSQFTVEAEALLFEGLQTDILMQVQVKSFTSLEREILQAGRGWKTTVLTDHGRSMLLRKILNDPEKEWESFPPSSRGSGFMELLVKELQEYKEYGIGPAALEEVAGEFAAGSSSQLKLQELAEIYRLYEEELSPELEDAEGRMQSAISQVNDLSVFQGVDFYFDHFYSLSRLELDFIAALHRGGRLVQVGLAMPKEEGEAILRFPRGMRQEEKERVLDELVPDASAFSLPAHFFSSLLAIAREEGEGRPIPSPYPSFEIRDASQQPGKPEAAFERLARSAFSFKRPEKGEGLGERVSVTQYRDTEAEVDGVLVAVQKLVIEEGARYRDIQLILTDQEAYSAYIQQKFTLQGIPFFFDEKRPIVYHPLTQLLLSLLKMLKDDFRREDVVHFMKSGLLCLSQEEVDSWQRFVDRRRIHHSMFFDDRYFTLDPDYAACHEREREGWEREYATAKRVNDQMKVLVAPLRSCLHQKRPAADFARALVNFLNQDVIIQAMDDYRMTLLSRENKQDRLYWEENEQLWEKTMAILDELVMIAGPDPLDFSRFIEMLEEGISGLTLGIIPPYQDQVMVSSLMRSRSRRRDYVFILGMNDSMIPKGKSSQGLLSPEEKAGLAQADYFLPSMDAFTQEEESYDFYLALIQAKKKLWLSCSLQDSQKGSMLPSYWLKRLVDQQGLEWKLKKDFELGEMVYSRPLSQWMLAEKIREGRGAEKAEALSLQRAMAAADSIQRQEDGQIINQALHYDNQRQKLSPEIQHALYDKKSLVTASQLEDYGACPYRYFVDYVLSPEELRTLAVDSLDIGNVLHSSVNAWTRHWEEIRGMSEEESARLAIQAFEREEGRVMDIQKRQDPLNQLLIQLNQKTLLENHKKLYRQLTQSDFQEVYHEASFGPGSAFPPLVFSLDPGLAGPADHRVLLHGRMDRLEVWHSPQGFSYYQLVDYKTGKRAFQLGDTLGGLTLQLPLYLSAVLQDDKARPFGFFYMPLQQEEKLRREKSDYEKKKGRASEGLLDGLLWKNLAVIQHADPDFGEENEETGLYSSTYVLKGKKKDLLEKENLLDEAEWRALLTSAREEAEKLLLSRNRGEIPIRPYRKEDKSTACLYCPFSSICRFDRLSQFKNYRLIPGRELKEWKEEVDGQGLKDRGEEEKGESK